VSPRQEFHNLGEIGPESTANQFASLVEDVVQNLGFQHVIAELRQDPLLLQQLVPIRIPSISHRLASLSIDIAQVSILMSLRGFPLGCTGFRTMNR
jgi:hypothetical protein